MHPRQDARDKLFQHFRSLRNTARDLIHQRAKRVRNAQTGPICRIKFRGFTITYETPFNATHPVLLEGHIRYPYALWIFEGEWLRFHVAWNRKDDDDVYVNWFSHEDFWDLRFLRIMKPDRPCVEPTGLLTLQRPKILRPYQRFVFRCSKSISTRRIAPTWWIGAKEPVVGQKRKRRTPPNSRTD
jgi:hypothetical protein